MMRTPWACLRSPRGPRRENGWRRGPKPRSGAGQALEQQSRWRRSKREKPEEGGLSWKSTLESEDPHAPPTPDSVCAGPTRLQDRDRTDALLTLQDPFSPLVPKSETALCPVVASGAGAVHSLRKPSSAACPRWDCGRNTEQEQVSAVPTLRASGTTGSPTSRWQL